MEKRIARPRVPDWRDPVTVCGIIRTLASVAPSSITRRALEMVADRREAMLSGADRVTLAASPAIQREP